MISDEERREVAAELRKAVQFDIDAGGIADPDDVYGAVGIDQDCGWFHAADVFRLADLIDRPTCTLTVNGDGSCTCSRCAGTMYAPDIMDSASDWNYCCNCDAEVVSDGDD